jgi:hypothetical protein
VFEAFVDMRLTENLCPRHQPAKENLLHIKQYVKWRASEGDDAYWMVSVKL